MYPDIEKIKEKGQRAGSKLQELQAKGKITPELIKLVRELEAAQQAGDIKKLEGILDQILEKVE